MKRIFIILVAAFSCLLGAQGKTQGVAIYSFYTDMKNVKTDDDKNISLTEKMEMENLMASMPDKQRIKVTFTENSAFAEPAFSLESMGAGGISFNAIMLIGTGDFYTDLQNKIVYNRVAVPGRKAELTKQNFGDIKWEITGEQQKIGEYNCTKAITAISWGGFSSPSSPSSVVAWFTEDIPAKIAPMYYYGLPGAVVKLEETTHTNSKMIYELEKIDYKPVEIKMKWDLNKAVPIEEAKSKQTEE